MVHKEVLKAYEENEMDYFNTASDENEKSFFEKAKASQHDVTHQITQIFRLMQGTKEKMYYQEIVASKDYLGNPIDHSRVVGKYQMPIFIKRVDSGSGKAMPTEVSSHDTIYELDFDPKKLEHLREIGHINEFTNFVLITQGRRYGNISFEEFTQNSYQDLFNICKYGSKNPELLKQIMKEQRKK